MYMYMYIYILSAKNCTEILRFAGTVFFGNTGRLFKIRRIFALYAVARHLLFRRFSEGVTIKVETVIGSKNIGWGHRRAASWKGLSKWSMH